jgi:hypothetical protein
MRKTLLFISVPTNLFPFLTRESQNKIQTFLSEQLYIPSGIGVSTDFIKFSSKLCGIEIYCNLPGLLAEPFGINSSFSVIPIPSAKRFSSLSGGFLVPFSGLLISA